MELKYPPKIIVAWSEAIAGNTKIREWLMQNGYPELGIFCFAVHLKDDARKWLLDNKFAHLMAVVNGAEGNQAAIKFLSDHNMKSLMHVALAGDGYKSSHKWLHENGHQELARVAYKLMVVKNQIESENNDIHKISRE